LQGTERQHLQAALLDAFRTYEDLAQVVGLHFGKNLEQIASPKEALPEVVRLLIQWAEARDEIELLIQSAKDENKTNKTLPAVEAVLLSAIEQRRPKGWYQPPDPYQTCYVHADRSFINRREFRNALRRLTQPLGLGVLIVNGPLGCGKTHSGKLVHYISQVTGAYDVAALDVKEEGKQIQPDELVVSVAGQMGIAVESMPKQQAPPARWLRELVNWLAGEIKRSGKTCWILLDGFGHPDVPKDTQDLIQRLVRRASQQLPQLRIVLLEFDDAKLPADVPAAVDLVSHLDKTHLIEFLADIFAHMKRQPGPTEVADMAEQVLASVQLPNNDPGRTEALAREIEARVKALF